MHKIPLEYRLDYNLTLHTTHIFVKREIPRNIIDPEDRRERINVLIDDYKEYHAFSKLVYNSRVLLEYEYFELLELIDVFKSFGNNSLKLVDNSHHIGISINISINKKNNPYTLDFKGIESRGRILEDFNLSFSAKECKLISQKLTKMTQLLVPLPSNIPYGF